jgi:hypothetical protein
MLLTQNMRDDSETLPKAIHMYEESQVTSALQSLEQGTYLTQKEKKKRVILTINTAVQVSIKTKME